MHTYIHTYIHIYIYTIMAYEGSESAQDNFGKFIHQFQPKTKTLNRKLKRILIKLYRQNVSLLFNQTCLNEWLLPNYIYIYIDLFYHHFNLYRVILCCPLYIYIYILCVIVSSEFFLHMVIWYLIQIICTQLFGLKYSYLILMII